MKFLVRMLAADQSRRTEPISHVKHRQFVAFNEPWFKLSVLFEPCFQTLCNRCSVREIAV